MTTLCSKCKTEPSLPYICYCKECHNKRQKRYYKEHPQSTTQSYKRRRASALALVAEVKNRPCMDCGKSFPACVMDFDHVRGVKEFTIGTSLGVSKNRLLKEIEKCDIVCSNCHRVRTFNRQKNNLIGL